MTASSPRPLAEVIAEFASHVRPEMADEHIDLAGCALLMAQTEYPTLDPQVAARALDALASRVSASLPLAANGGHDWGGAGSAENVAAINQVLFQEEGFRGNRDDYYDPRNSYVNDVLDRRLGIPITLALVYVEVARRIGFPLAGVGLPGHFLLKHYDLNGEGILIDAYEGGVIVSAADCQRRLDEIYSGNVSLQPQFLVAITRRQWLHRMLNNLKTVYISQRNFKKALPFAEMILAIYPRSAEDVKQRAVLRYHNRQVREALADFDHYLSMAPEASDAGEIRQTLLAIRRQLANMN